MIPLYYWLFDARGRYEQTVDYEGPELQVGDTLSAGIIGETGSLMVYEKGRFCECGSFQDVVSLKRVA